MDIEQKSASVCTSHAGSNANAEHAIGETPDLFAGLVSSNDRSLSSSSKRSLLSSGTPESPRRASTNAAVTQTTQATQATSEARGARKSKPRKTAVTSARRKKIAQIDHLAAARKLQRQLRRTRSHSPEEVKTGRLICRHLLALLNEAAQNDALDQKSA